MRQILIRVLLAGIFAFGVLLLAVTLIGPQWSKGSWLGVVFGGIGMGVLLVLLIVAVQFSFNRPIGRQKEGYDPERYIKDLQEKGLLVLTDFRAVRAFQVEKYEDEGLHYFIELVDGSVLYLTGQDLYDYEPIDDDPELNRPRRFPCKDFTLRTHREGEYVVDIVCRGEVIKEEEVVPHPKEFWEWSPEDGEIITDRTYSEKEQRMYGAIKERLTEELGGIEAAGLFKNERIIMTPQDSHIRVGSGPEVLNLCANNYLGLAEHPAVLAAARKALDEWGFGMASVRFICGTQGIHKQLEAKLSEFLGTEDTILYGSCFDANGGLFETLLGPEDAVISDALNHASIIDGIRLSKAQRLRYAHNDMAELEAKLQEAAGARTRLIATDGVFSMDGTIADLQSICNLAERYDALVMMDDCHSTGFLGKTGRGTHEYRGVMGRVDILTGTLGKALGGASGGYTSGRKEVVSLLRQRSRPYLFSNTLAPPIAAASLAVLEMLSESTTLRDKLEANTCFFRDGMTQLGYTLLPGEHPIVPVMLGDAALAGRVSEAMLAKGVYVVGFSYPVVPQGKARIRTQISAAHSLEDLAFAVQMFGKVKAEMGL